MIQKQGHWVPYELKPRTTASTAEKKRFFASHRIATGDEKWIHYDNPKRRKSWGKPLEAGDRYRLQLMRLSRALKEKRPLYAQRHDKVILLHDNARPHVAKPVKTYLETLKWEVLPHPPYSPDIAPSDFHLFVIEWIFCHKNHSPINYELTVELIDINNKQVEQFYTSYDIKKEEQKMLQFSHTFEDYGVGVRKIIFKANLNGGKQINGLRIFRTCVSVNIPEKAFVLSQS
ncbi:MOS1T transposase, partial [Pseudoatta argentina]